MQLTPRENMKRCLEFSTPERIPRDLWTLPWAEKRYPGELETLRAQYPGDIVTAPAAGMPSPCRKGDPYNIGEAIDDWGCIFTNIQEGVHGEVKSPILTGDTPDPKTIRPPVENIPADPAKARDRINRFCGTTDRFVLAQNLPRPWERYQFMRGTENSMVDVMMPEEGLAACLKVIHEHYLRELEFWVSTDVDAVFFMDDWGSQAQLLIPPEIWRALFKPLYKDYCDLAHAHGKYAFMHSDGYISEIYGDLVEAGIDAMNSQLFVMDMADLARRVKGKITFWGEMDRQHVVTSPDPQKGREGVRKVAEHLYDPCGGIIAQLEFGPGGNPATVMAVFDEWNRI
jgi:uroporphyrinogen decarboxylase